MKLPVVPMVQVIRALDFVWFVLFPMGIVCGVTAFLYQGQPVKST